MFRTFLSGMGLSDEIRSMTGEIQLDAMFADERLGSLSEDALNQAVKDLDNLMEGKNSWPSFLCVRVNRQYRQEDYRIEKRS